MDVRGFLHLRKTLLEEGKMNVNQHHTIGMIGVALLALALTSCSSQEAKQSGWASPAPGANPAVAPESPRVQAPAVKPAANVAAPRPAAIKPAAINPLNDPRNILSKRSLYYDYDEATIKTEFRALVEAHARYLKEHPGANVAIEGNCDERGTREYNIALGQRRAESVKSMLILLGAAANQVEAISLGEEKPKADGHGEQAWSQNRRSDIIYRRTQ